jgi:hypothetical protein
MAKGGSRPGAGRPKGSPNKITTELRDMVLNALARAGGESYLVSQAEAEPAAFLTLVGKCLPKDINLTAGLRLQVNLVKDHGRPAND